jgi:hypothetical protein
VGTSRPDAIGPSAPRGAVTALIVLAVLGLLLGPLGGAADAASGRSGLTWAALSPSQSPPGLVGATAAYDAANSTIVVFGGRREDGELSDRTWVWNGSTWSMAGIVGAVPPARAQASMAFDAELDPPQLILFGGRGNSGVLLDDTWTWNGSSWNQVQTADSPGGRAGAATTTDGSGHVVLFGGYGIPSSTVSTGPSTSTTTTTPDPTTTTTSPTTTLPPATTTTDPASSTTTDTTTPPSSATTVPAAAQPAADRPAANRTASPAAATRVATSGAAAGRTTAARTTAGRTTATRTTATRTTATRTDLAGAPIDDSAAATPRVLDDTWILTQSSSGADLWRPVPVSTHPPALTDASLATGPTGETVLFGGTSRPPGNGQAGGTSSATWTWNGRSWSHRTLRTGPSARQDATLIADADVGGIVLSGGLGRHGALGDTWIWSGSSWLRATPTAPPSSRSGAAAAYDPQGLQLVVFGGAGASGSVLSSTEVLSTHAPTTAPPPTTTTTRPTTTGTGGRTGPGPSGGHGTTGGTSLPSDSSPGSADDPGTTISVLRGGVVTLTGSGFLPGAKITITFHSKSVTVGSTRADAEGVFRIDVPVPTQAATGEHHFVATGMGPHGLIDLVTPIRVMALSTTHRTSTTTKLVLVAIALAIPALAWAGFDLAGRRRRPSATA